MNIINENENLQYTSDTIYLIQKLFKSDIRSMINYMQSNQQIIYNKKIVQTSLWDKITENIKNKELKYNIDFITKVSNDLEFYEHYMNKSF